MSEKFQISSFYEFQPLGEAATLKALCETVRSCMSRNSIVGTVILASEGFNASVCGKSADMSEFITQFEATFKSRLRVKSSFHDRSPFRKTDVKIRPEIVTLKKSVDNLLGCGTHLSATEWNEMLTRENVTVLDARNDYEFRSGTFRGAVNPKTEKFSDLPAFIEQNLDPDSDQVIATFCTGGIRCEKLVPYLKSRGFRNVFQLNGGILKYLEDIAPDESLWVGECFVFDERRTVNERLEKGDLPDFSQPDGRKSR